MLETGWAKQEKGELKRGSGSRGENTGRESIAYSTKAFSSSSSKENGKYLNRAR